MKKTWLDQQELILEELKKIFVEQVPLTFCQQGCMAQISSLQEIVRRDGKETILVLEKPDDFTLKDEGYFVFYRRPGQSLLRGFQGHLIKTGDGFFLVSFPRELYKVQRRRHPRVSTPPPSHFSMSPSRSRRLLSGEVVDVSREGALLRGDMEAIEKGQEISPLSMTLYLENDKLEPVQVVVSLANIVRVIKEDEGDDHLVSLQFWQKNCDHQALEQYLEWRAIEGATG